MKKTVMLVDDDIEIRLVITDVLEDEGFKVITANNGQEGLSMLKTMDILPGLVILDFMMPILDGRGFRQAQLQDPRLANIPTAFFSADGKIIQKANEPNAEAIRKPVDLKELLALVRKYCE